MAKRVGPPKVGPRKPKIVAKVRRTRNQAYGSRNDWATMSTQAKCRDGYRCRRCGSTDYLQVDHIIPVAKGGRTILSNLWTLCDLCHSKRPGHQRAKHLIMHQRNKVQKYLKKKKL